VNAVRDGVEDLEAVLCSPESQRQLVPLGPQVVANRSKSRKTIDSEDTQKRCLAQEDGTLVTESRRTTEHELIIDDELPDPPAAHSTAPDDRGLQLQVGEQVTTTAANQRFFRQRDEQHVDVLANGRLHSTEMRYAAETTQMDKDGPADLERPGDWDSLSDRMRKLRRSQQQQQKGESTSRWKTIEIGSEFCIFLSGLYNTLYIRQVTYTPPNTIYSTLPLYE